MKNKFLPTDNYVKVLGRTIMLDDCRLLCTSGSGVEFTYTGSRLTVTFYGDDSTNCDDSILHWRDIARVQVIVDDHIMLDTSIKAKKETYVVYGEDPSWPSEQHTVRIIKLSEPRMSSVGLGEIEIESDAMPVPTPDKKKFVEFIGDSITCGYGVDTEHELCPFSTCTENAARAYAYLAAKQLDIDFSLVSYSGHGLVSGWTPDANIPKKEELLPPYYEIVAYSYNSFRGLNPQDYSWNFVRQPDVIVINLGTNDFSYTQDNIDKINEYKKCYLTFLQQVRKLNNTAHIICSLGVMGDELYPAVEQVVNEYKEKYDTNISAFHFTPQNPEADGLAADYHPSPITQQKASKELIIELNKWL